MVHGPWRLAAEHVGIQRGIGQPAPQSELREAGTDVAHAVQFLPHPAGAQLLGIGREFRRLAAGQRLHHRFRRQHAGLHRGMRALDLRHVDEPGRVADQQPAGEHQVGDRLPAALVQRARAVADAPATVEMLAHLGMGLEALHLIERRQPGIAVVQPDDEAVRNEVAAEVVQERPAIGACGPTASRWCVPPGRACGFPAGISHSSLMPMA